MLLIHWLCELQDIPLRSSSKEAWVPWWRGMSQGGYSWGVRVTYTTTLFLKVNGVGRRGSYLVPKHTEIPYSSLSLGVPMLKATCQLPFLVARSRLLFNSHPSIVDKNIKPLFTCHKVLSHSLHSLEVSKVHSQRLERLWLQRRRHLDHFADASHSFLFCASSDVHFCSFES